MNRSTTTVFPRKDTTATIYFVTGIGVAFNQGWLLFEGVVNFFSARNVGMTTPSIECSTHGVVPHLLIGTRTFIANLS